MKPTYWVPIFWLILGLTHICLGIGAFIGGYELIVGLYMLLFGVVSVCVGACAHVVEHQRRLISGLAMLNQLAWDNWELSLKEMVEEVKTKVEREKNEQSGR